MLRLAAACLVVLSACASPVADGAGPFDSEADYRAQRSDAVAALDAAIGVPTADHLGACRAVGVGDKACGGPVGFAVYSVTAADSARVQSAGRRVTDLDRRANDQFEFVSTCVLVSAPSLAVEDGVCVAVR